MSIEINLLCDQCGNIIDGSAKSAADVRATAKREGMAYRMKGRDICRHCVPLPVRPAERQTARETTDEELQSRHRIPGVLFWRT
jgi:hypothetical protein